VKQDKLPKSLFLHIQNNTTIAYFDGATHQSGAYCGAGGVLKLPDFSCIRWTFNGGQGTNTKAELLGAWAAIRLALHLSISRLQLVGDSKVVIAWLAPSNLLSLDRQNAPLPSST
jgi:ribonuclease HI